MNKIIAREFLLFIGCLIAPLVIISVLLAIGANVHKTTYKVPRNDALNLYWDMEKSETCRTLVALSQLIEQIKGRHGSHIFSESWSKEQRDIYRDGRIIYGYNAIDNILTEPFDRFLMNFYVDDLYGSLRIALVENKVRSYRATKEDILHLRTIGDLSPYQNATTDKEVVDWINELWIWVIEYKRVEWSLDKIRKDWKNNYFNKRELYDTDAYKENYLIVLLILAIFVFPVRFLYLGIRWSIRQF